MSDNSTFFFDEATSVVEVNLHALFFVIVGTCKTFLM